MPFQCRRRPVCFLSTACEWRSGCVLWACATSSLGMLQPDCVVGTAWRILYTQEGKDGSERSPGFQWGANDLSGPVRAQEALGGRVLGKWTATTQHTHLFVLQKIHIFPDYKSNRMRRSGDCHSLCQGDDLEVSIKFHDVTNLIQRDHVWVVSGDTPTCTPACSSDFHGKILETT